MSGVSQHSQRVGDVAAPVPNNVAEIKEEAMAQLHDEIVDYTEECACVHCVQLRAFQARAGIAGPQVPPTDHPPCESWTPNLYDALARVRNPQNGPPWSPDPLYIFPILKSLQNPQFYPAILFWL